MTLARALERSIRKKNSQTCHKPAKQKNEAGPKHIELGVFGENLAAEYLIGKGYQILHRNVFFRCGEIDIIARDGDEIVFVEVRTRTIGRLSPPETTVGPRKIQKLVRSANAWVDRVRYPGFWRVDLVAITVVGDENKIEHIKTITEAIS